MINSEEKHRNKVFDAFVNQPVYISLIGGVDVAGVFGYSETLERYFIEDEQGRKRFFNKCKVKSIRKKVSVK